MQLTYNGFGELTKDQQSHSGAVGGGTPSVQYTYRDGSGENNSRQVTMTYPNGRVISDGYGTSGGLNDTISRLSAVLDGSTTLESYKYLGLGTVVERDRPQDLVNLTYISSGGTGNAGDKYVGLDLFGRIVDQNWFNTSTLSSADDFQYGYDRDGNALYRNNTVNTAFGELYHASGAGNGYDNFNQLSAYAVGVLSASGGSGTPLDTVASPTKTESWATDALGNFTSETLNGTQTNRTLNLQNQITAVGATSLTYDANGNTKTDDLGHTFVVDAWNRVVTVKNGGTTIDAFHYDAMGRRIVEIASQTLDLYFSQDGNIVERDTAGVAKAQYVWDPLATNTLIEHDRDADNNPNTGPGGLEERLYYQEDANNDTTALVNTSGSVVERYTYDPYGAPTYLNASWGTIGASAYAVTYLFQGGRYDPLTGNSKFGARDYSTTQGTWLEQDPAGYGAGSLDLYGAEGQNPVNSVDPTGLDSFSEWWNDFKTGWFELPAATGRAYDRFSESVSNLRHGRVNPNFTRGLNALVENPAENLPEFGKLAAQQAPIIGPGLRTGEAIGNGDVRGTIFNGAQTGLDVMMINSLLRTKGGASSTPAETTSPYEGMPKYEDYLNGDFAPTTKPAPNWSTLEETLTTGQKATWFEITEGTGQGFSARLTGKELQVAWTGETQGPLFSNLQQVQLQAGGPGSFTTITAKASATLEQLITANPARVQRVLSEGLTRSLGETWDVTIKTENGVHSITGTRKPGS